MTKKLSEEFPPLLLGYIGSRDAQDWLLEHKGIDYASAVQREIGYDEIRKQYVFPMRSLTGDYVSLKRFEQDETDKSDWMIEADYGYTEVSLAQSISSEYYNKKICFNGVVIGKDLSPYTIPYIIKMNCIEIVEKKEKPDKCFYCPLQSGQEIEFKTSLEADKEMLVSLIGASDQQVKGAIRKNYNVPSYNSCRNVSMDLTQRMRVEEIRLTNEIDYERIDSEYVIHKCYLFNNKIQTNQQYEFWGTHWNDPQTQHSIHIINKIRGKRDSISKWKADANVQKLLEPYRCKDQNDKNEIYLKLAEIQRDLSLNVTKMYKREAVIQAFDLVMHSALNFKFRGQMLTKGWLECGVIGDTRTGKTETIKALIHHYRSGEFVTSGENTTLAGLLGGVQQTHNGRWSLTWGKMPMNDRRALVVDEADTLLEQGIMGHLSGVRSSGVAELVKIQTQKTMARTRLIFIANPLNGSIAEYGFGVEAIPEIYGKPQDISRVDFAIMCAKNDVSDSEINSAEERAAVDHVFTTELSQARVMYAWTRDHTHISFTEDAEMLILRLATDFGKKYSPIIPLVIGAEFRIKLARIAVSMAIQVLSTDPEDFEKVIVTAAHVLVSAEWLQKQYDGETMDYLAFSVQKKLDGQVRNEETLEDVVNDADKANQLLSCARIQLGDAEDIWAVDRVDARKKISTLRKCGAIKKTSYYYVKTEPFIDWLKKRRAYFYRQNNPF